MSASGPILKCKMQLTLVFSYGLDITIRNISNAGISDHFPVKFDADLSNAELKLEGPRRLVRIIDSGTVANFSVAFINSDQNSPPTLVK